MKSDTSSNSLNEVLDQQSYLLLTICLCYMIFLCAKCHTRICLRLPIYQLQDGNNIEVSPTLQKY